MTSVLLYAHRLVDPVSTMTGIGRYVEHITKALATVAGEGWQFDAASTAEKTTPAWLPADVRYRRVRGPRRPVHLAWTALNAPRLERLVGPFDLLHALQPSIPLPTDHPAIVTVHDVMPIEHPEWYQPRECWAFRRTLKYAVDRGWHVIADSQYAADTAVEFAGMDRDKISVVHLAVDDAFRRPSTLDRQREVCARFGVEPGRYLLTVGNVSTRKNVPTLVRALAGVPRPEVALLLAGRVHESGDAVIAEIDRLGLGSRVRVAGFVPDADLRVLVQGALALAHPSVDEGFGLPPLEAMAAGVAVVAARAGSVPEIVGDGGVLVEPLGEDAWTAALTMVVEDDEERRRLVAAGRTQSAAFTWERAAQQTLAVYERVLRT